MYARSRLTSLTRIGFATRGLLYIVIAFLIVRTGRAEDISGALQYLGHGGGRVLLGIMAAGLFAYGLWRASDAVFDIEQHGSDRKGAAERVGAAVSSLVHLFLTWQALRLMQGVSSSGDGARDGTQAVLALPGGMVLVIFGGVLLFGVGIVQLRKAIKGSYLQYLEPRIARQAWARWSGRAGYAARGLVFIISSAFLIMAGFREQASEAGGMAQVLAWLTSPWDIVVATGLFGFGLFSLIEARFRILHDVPIKGIARRMAEVR